MSEHRRILAEIVHHRGDGQESTAPIVKSFTAEDAEDAEFRLDASADRSSGHDRDTSPNHSIVQSLNN
jgi:hypothetical protein